MYVWMVAREEDYNVLFLVPLFAVDRPVILVEVLHVCLCFFFALIGAW